MATEEYRKKRDFRQSPEPAPGIRTGVKAEGDGGFVVHRHEARSLHYDLRIEAGGALACWAVPKGFSYEPTDKRLAVRVEDHPLEYEDFEGVIPRGQYGAGNMDIWDSGTYEVKKSASIGEALEKGELKLVLKGRKLRGEWHLVRTKAGGGRDWLLFKAKDRYAGSGSVLFGSADLSLALRRPMPARARPMEAARGFAPFSDPLWLFETAFPGIRVRARLDGPRVSLASSEGDLAQRLPAICSGLGRVRAERALMDAVLLALDKDGLPSRAALEEDLASGGAKAALYVFDILFAEDWDLRAMPLTERKALLRALVPEGPRVFAVDPVPERGEAFARAAADSGLTAIVAKRAESPYRAGPCDDWRMIALEVATPESRAKRPAAGRRAAALSGISNPRKVYWPDQGYTKEDLARYYDTVALFLLPYLEDRPLHLYRWPAGVRGKSFYQKQLPEGLPEWVETVDVARPGEEARPYILCNDRRTLLSLINTGTIDLHPWLSRKGSLDSPDWAVLDLDPKAAPFSDVVKLARAAGRLLRSLGLEPYLKTSGSTGLHVFVPLKSGYSYEQTRMFCETAARIIVREHGGIATVERAVGRRGGRVYIDYMQNRREQTVVPPYVARPVEAATVSMPLSWDELEEDFSLADFTIMSAPGRLERIGDLFRGALSRPQDLGKAIGALGDYLKTP